MEKKVKNISNYINVVIWLLVLIAPVLLTSENNHADWRMIFSEWLRMWPFFLIFFLNNVWLFSLFEKRKYKAYFLLISLSIVIISFLNHLTPLFHQIIEPFPRGPQRPEDIARFAPFMFFNTLLISILVVGLNDAIRIGVNWVSEQKRIVELEKENLAHQLDSLRNQINPHFFMNTLNNIHALIDYDSNMAKSAVIKLSKLMRVLLYDSEREGYTIKKEIQFLNDYIELMRYRLADNVKISFDFPEIIPNVKIQPLLFISFLENAFKHGIKAQGESFINLKMSADEYNLQVSIENSIAEKNMEESGGIGLKNARKRLELLYPDKFEMKIHKTDNLFKVDISIPI